ncbi:MAG: methyltransferase domain-containing protein, partial [Deltaproteobacteria bacterium]|nr:methyltransferase domain-containing protein [Deltaproteobacteria bacterium]
MNTIDTDSKVDLLFQLNWKSDNVNHTDCFQANQANIWRDIFPPDLQERLMGRQGGDQIELLFDKGRVLPSFQKNKLMEIKRKQFDVNSLGNHANGPQLGRFYPKGLLKDVVGVFRDNIAPFRCVGINNGSLSVDFNHPLADKDIRLSTIVGKIEPKRMERGGTSIDWMEQLTNGPGMQARCRGQASDYLTGRALERKDSTKDSFFYRNPRFTQHLDDTALSMVTNTYDRFMDDGMQVLDLMSSWQSHIPGRHRLKRLAGLGLNQSELERNYQLTESVVQDLNTEPQLPYADAAFDLIICTVSVEYLINPLAVFEDAARVLKPGGYMVITFSNRWFPTKAIRLWTELHEFERMGLVLEYFRRTQAFDDLHTYSMRGLPRPHGDKYFPERIYSDPLYAVWGRKQ